MATSSSSSTSGGGIDRPRPKITLFVDTVSPFAYVAYYILRVRTVFTYSSRF